MPTESSVPNATCTIVTSTRGNIMRVDTPITSCSICTPVDKCTTPYFSLIMLHCVPLPEAGAPAMMMRGPPPVAAMLIPLSSEPLHASRGSQARLLDRAPYPSDSVPLAVAIAPAVGLTPNQVRVLLLLEATFDEHGTAAFGTNAVTVDGSASGKTAAEASKPRAVAVRQRLNNILIIMPRERV